MSQITVHLREPIGRIHPELHGQFIEQLGACVHGGIWVGEASPIANLHGLRLDVVEALKRLAVPVLRWPGGCFADDYDWTDGIGPKEQRPRRLNGWWGHDVETNHFGTHEFMHLCRLIGAKAYLAGNVGSGTPRQLKQWVEYCNVAADTTLSRLRATNGAPEPFKVAYWGVGNEAWGCGGSLCPEDYAALYKRFATHLATFTRPPLEMPLFLIACGPNGNDAEWTRRFFLKAGAPSGDWRLDGWAAHYYCGTAGTATDFTTNQWFELLHRAAAIEELILEQRALLDEWDPQRRIGLIVDEWGTWHPPTPGRQPLHLWQQNTLRDALVAALTLDVFHRHCDKVVMGNLAQAVNVLQALILTEEERMVLTPTYHVFDLYRPHQGAQGVRAQFGSNEILFTAGRKRMGLAKLNGSASIIDSQLTLSVTNLDPANAVEATVELIGGSMRELRVAELMAGALQAHNTFEVPEAVRPRYSHLGLSGERWRHVFAPASVTVLSIGLGT